VPLSGAEQEPVERWRYSVCVVGADDSYTQVEVWMLTQVLESVVEQFHDWVLSATRDGLRGLELAVRSAQAAGDKTCAASNDDRADLLRGELRDAETACTRERPTTAPQLADPLERDEVLQVLSDLDFERLVSTVLHAEFTLPTDTVRVYAYQAAPSVGVLLQGARDEAARLARRAGERLLYWFVTSTRLGETVRAQIANVLADAIPSRDHVIGALELRALAAKHANVSRQHVKYVMACNAYTRPAAIAPAAWPTDEIAEGLPGLVQTEAFEQARCRLSEQGAVVITGRRGSGKTTLARMLLAVSGHDLEPLLFFDDVKDTRQAAEVVAKARRTGRKVVIVVHEAVAARYVDAPRIDLSHHARRDRALMLYNRLWHDDAIDPDTRMALTQPAGYRAIIDAPEFTPRWCADVLTETSGRTSPAPIAAAVDDIDEIFGRLRRRDEHDSRTQRCRQ
jgi:hypothetical protein